MCGFWQIRRKKHKHTHLEFFGNLVCSHSYVAVTIMETVVNSSNAALMRRIVQLENEKDELQKDIETICLQQAGVPSSIDLTTRMQARR